MNKEKKLKDYIKPTLEIHGDLKNITKGGQNSGSEPRSHTAYQS